MGFTEEMISSNDGLVIFIESINGLDFENRKRISIV